MSGAVRAARAAWAAGGPRREAYVPVRAVTTPPSRAPRVASPPTAGTEVPPAGVRVGAATRRTRLSLVLPTDAAKHGVVTAAVGQVPGSSGTAEAGVC